MALFMKLDLWSIMDELDKMTDYYIDGREKESIYWDFYSDQINDLGIAAADMLSEIEGLKRKIWLQMPEKQIDFCGEDSCTMTAVSWFNTAACMLSDTDMAALLEGENNYVGDYDREKEKRINALERLTKKQQMFLYTEVVGFIMRFLQLKSAFDVIMSCINELEYHQSFAVNKGGSGVLLPDAAYV